MTVLYKRTSPAIEFHDDELKYLTMKPFAAEYASRFVEGAKSMVGMTEVDDVEIYSNLSVEFVYDERYSQICAMCDFQGARHLLKTFEVEPFISSIVNGTVESNETFDKLPIMEEYANVLRGAFAKLLLEKYHIVVSGWDVADVFGVIKSKEYIISTFDGFRVEFTWNRPARIFLQNCLTPTPFTDFEDAKIEFYSGAHKYNVDITRDAVRNHAIFKSGTTHDVIFQKGSCIEASEEEILKATPFSKFDDDEAWAADRETYLSKIEDTQNIQDEFEDMFSF